ncbi:MAG: NAD(P)/FAD-dependent oxidoreductase [Yaniella sp.]|nr:NAD(P)/FAD-dependent oxidoreductase [Yaniella sp.]
MSATSSTTAEQEFDLIVLGAGPIGETLALAVAKQGLKPAIVEHDLVGGDCAYYACKPSKALLRPIEVAATTQHLRGVENSHVGADDLLTRRDEQVSNYDDSGQKKSLESAGVTVVRGHGQLNGERTVEVHGSDGTTQTLRTTRAVVVTTGTTPNIPPVFDGIPVWNSQDATSVQDVPARLVIIGAGAVACEAATWMNALGSKVTMLVREGSLMSNAEPFVSDILTDQFSDAGIDVRFFTEATQVQRPDGMDPGLGKVKGGTVSIRTSEGETLEAEELLLATGRRPALESINLDSIGLSADDVLQQRIPDWLHALGDAGGKHQLTHMGKYQAKQFAAAFLDQQVHELAIETPTPQVVFTDPQVASVGLTEEAANDAGYDVVTGEVDFADVVGAGLLRDDVVGKGKVVVDKATGCLLGATLMGPETGEMLHAATIAITGQVSVSTLQHAVPVFPTASEVWVGLLDQVIQ